MKTIPEKYEGRADQKGATFTLLSRHGEIPCMVAVYLRESGGQTTYEVARVRKAKKQQVLNGRVIREEGDEYLPSTSEWGQYGWTFATEAEALKKVEEVLGCARQ